VAGRGADGLPPSAPRLSDNHGFAACEGSSLHCSERAESGCRDPASAGVPPKSPLRRSRPNAGIPCLFRTICSCSTPSLIRGPSLHGLCLRSGNRARTSAGSARSTCPRAGRNTGWSRSANALSSRRPPPPTRRTADTRDRAFGFRGWSRRV